ncbi:MAG: SRPBCC family protein [Candidatus Eremiobacteraeota bacterium]|nr:SRPBCC family protein [Candidatus Eremiobacteraeota bacterium]
MSSGVVVTTPSEREICVTRTFAAPAQVVFDFHTKPEHLKKWLLGPPGWSMPVCEIDLRAGGRYRYLWRSDENDREFGVQGQFREVSAPTRIVHTESMDGRPGEALCTLELSESANRTELVLTMEFPSKAERDAALESGMTDGMSLSYDRLEENMAGGRR